MPMRRRGLVGLPWVVLAACSGPVNPTADSGFTEGTRLKAVYFEAEGAPRRFLNWYDTQLGVDCMFADVGLPDRMVCFPTDQLGSSSLFVPEIFVDSGIGCTAPLVPLPACDVHFLVRSPKSGDPCGTPVRLFPLNGSCQLGPEIPLETLVSGTYRPAAGPGRIVPLTIVASDGSVQGAGTTSWFQGNFGGEAYPQVVTKWVAWDAQRDEMVSASSDQAERVDSLWHPSIGSYPGLFEDAACNVPVAIASVCPVRAKEAYVWVPPEGCGDSPPTNFASLEPPGPVGASLYYGDSAGATCQVEPPDPNSGRDPMAAGFPLGAPIPATAFAAATEVRTGAKQLQLRQAGTPDGRGAYPVGFGFFDTVHGQPCTVGVQAADGALRCLPSWPSTIDLSDPYVFADAACTIPIVSLGPPGACGSQPSFVTRIENTPTVGSPAPPTGCTSLLLRGAGRHHIYSIGDRYPGTVYDKSSPGQCISRDSPAPEGQEPQTTYYEIGPEIPASDFAAVKYVRPQ